MVILDVILFMLIKPSCGRPHVRHRRGQIAIMQEC